MESRTTSHEWSDPDGRPWTVTLTWRGYECVGFALEAASAGAGCRITTALVRLVPLGALMQEARQSLAITKPAAPRTSAGPDSRKPDRDYHEVANVYFRAWVRGEAPLEVIAEKYTVSHSTAARWVRVARKRGILSPAEHGRAGGYPRWIDPAEDVSDPDYKWSDFQKEGE